MTKNEMVYPGIGRHRDKRKELARNRKGRIVGGKKRLETVCPSTCIKTKMMVGKKRNFSLINL
jgi:hypothetical protein